MSYKYATAHHSIEYTPTESSVGGSLLQKSLPKNINLPKKFESAFIEVIMPKSSNLTTGCIYKHPLLLWLMSLQMILFHHYFKNFKKSSQKIFLMGDFNNDSMTYENFEQVNSFVDSLASNFLSCKYFYPHEYKLLLH